MSYTDRLIVTGVSLRDGSELDNLRKFRSSEQVKDHVIRRGFKQGYNRWIWHGESLLPSSSGGAYKENDDIEKGKSSDDDNDGDNDRIDEMIRDMQGDCSEMPHLKSKNGYSDKGFTELLELLKDMFPDNNELPSSTYECGASRYKRKNVVDVCEDKKGPPTKVLWYLPIIPRFKRLFANPNDAKNLQWHAKGRKDDGKLRNPADSPQWSNINRMFPEFGCEDRNLRLGLCTDGMNPHGNMSSRHSTWPVLLVVYNLPPWLCMKHMYIMLSLMISRPKQPGNDIDVYLTPLIDDLKILWNEGVDVFDAYSQTNFTLRAMIFCTINDFPTYGNLSGYTTKGAKACPICEDETNDLWLSNSRKNVFMSHRKFLSIDHPYRKKKKPFNGKIETRLTRLPLLGTTIYERVKNLNVDLGKIVKTSHKSLWKKRSIFWDLPYWEHLDVRHCIDVMQVEKNVCDSIVGTLLNI
ncbi:uncharacterized protein LOC116022441 [Ipomoea triloba]|uniref:uncharacterized protein LOC116022441 n=1 Tax=Ipomoea triloba TaxID=35885 RepID=UPI00125D3A63|nr:uncharacterized protein LOC116022441 [Ipomoea triloba]